MKKYTVQEVALAILKQCDAQAATHLQKSEEKSIKAKNEDRTEEYRISKDVVNPKKEYDPNSLSDEVDEKLKKSDKCEKCGKVHGAINKAKIVDIKDKQVIADLPSPDAGKESPKGKLMLVTDSQVSPVDGEEKKDAVNKADTMNQTGAQAAELNIAQPKAPKAQEKMIPKQAKPLQNFMKSVEAKRMNRK